MKHAPVVIRLSERDTKELDLMKELHVDRHSIGKELLKQPAKYAWWGAMYAQVESKVEVLEGRLDELFGELARSAVKKEGKLKAGEVKHIVITNPEYQKLLQRVYKWRSSKRILKHAVKAFEQRLHALQSYAADQRKERDSEPRVRKASQSSHH